MIKRITATVAHQMAEGMRLTSTYSVIDDAGNIVKDNAKISVIVLDNEILDAINRVNNFMLGKIPE